MANLQSKIPSDALVVDRISFMSWAEGILLDFRAGSGIVGDHEDFERAEKILKEGGRIYLRYQRKVVTYMELSNGQYQEFLL